MKLVKLLIAQALILQLLIPLPILVVLEMVVEEIPVPCFQPLGTVRGEWSSIVGQIAAFKKEAVPTWLEVVYDGDELLGDLQEKLRELIQGSSLEILRTRNLRLAQRTLSRMATEETLDDLDPGQVFARLQSIDPNTSLPPNVLTGFLPPEDGTGRGQGYFSYTVQPKAGLATGTPISNVALVSFDGEPQIATDQVDLWL